MPPPPGAQTPTDATMPPSGVEYASAWQPGQASDSPAPEITPPPGESPWDPQSWGVPPPTQNAPQDIMELLKAQAVEQDQRPSQSQIPAAESGEVNESPFEQFMDQFYAAQQADAALSGGEAPPYGASTDDDDESLSAPYAPYDDAESEPVALEGPLTDAPPDEPPPDVPPAKPGEILFPTRAKLSMVRLFKLEQEINQIPGVHDAMIDLTDDGRMALNMDASPEAEARVREFLVLAGLLDETSIRP